MRAAYGAFSGELFLSCGNDKAGIAVCVFTFLWNATAMKRPFDILVSVILMLALAPLVLAIALAVKLESPGPILYRSRRIGRHQRAISVLKFRKMSDGATGLPLTVLDDARFTRLGRSLARWKLDELPQLWNVIRGDMSLVGPRPEDPAFVALRSADYERILTVRPGITGPSQIVFADEGRMLEGPDPVATYVESVFPMKIALDRLYARRRSFSGDLQLLAHTAGLPFRRVSYERMMSTLDPGERGTNVAEPAPESAS